MLNSLAEIRLVLTCLFSSVSRYLFKRWKLPLPTASFTLYGETMNSVLVHSEDESIDHILVFHPLRLIIWTYHCTFQYSISKMATCYLAMSMLWWILKTCVMLVESILQCSVLLLPHPPIWWFLPLYIFFQNHPPCPKYTLGKHNNNLIRERFFFLFWRLQNNVTFPFYKQPQAEIWFKTITANYDHYIEETSRQTTKYHKFPMKVTDISTTYPKLLLKKATSQNAHA